MPATNVAVVPYLAAIVYQSTFVRYSDFVTFSHTPQALHFHRFYPVGTEILDERKRNTLIAAIQRCNAFVRNRDY